MERITPKEHETPGYMTPEDIVDQSLELNDMAIAYGDTKRATELPDGRRENDVLHSYTLGLVAGGLALRHYPQLDQSKVLWYAHLHDLPELLSGDEPTFMITPEEAENKRLREETALELLEEHQLRNWPELYAILRDYEDQQDPESRFVRLIDKLMPGLINILNHGLTLRGFHEVDSTEDIDDSVRQTTDKMAAELQEFPLIAEVYETLVRKIKAELFNPETGEITTQPTETLSEYAAQIKTDKRTINQRYPSKYHG